MLPWMVTCHGYMGSINWTQGVINSTKKGNKDRHLTERDLGRKAGRGDGEKMF